MPKKGYSMSESQKDKIRQSVVKRAIERKKDIVNIQMTIKLSRKEYNTLAEIATSNGRMGVGDEILCIIKDYINKIQKR